MTGPGSSAASYATSVSTICSSACHFGDKQGGLKSWESSQNLGFVAPVLVIIFKLIYNTHGMFAQARTPRFFYIVSEGEPVAVGVPVVERGSVQFSEQFHYLFTGECSSTPRSSKGVCYSPFAARGGRGLVLAEVEVHRQ